MEWKIGEIFEYNGEWYQCIEGYNCKDCDLRNRICHRDTEIFPFNRCAGAYREDKKSVIFKKLEKVGEPITERDRTFQCLKALKTECVGCVFLDSKKSCDKDHYIDGPCPDCEIWVEIKQNKEDMEEKKQKWGVSSDTINEINKGIEPMNTSRNIDTEHSNSEKIGKNLKEFDLEAAKAGKPVCTRDGRKARIICFDFRISDRICMIAAIEFGKTETISYYDLDGKCRWECNNKYDLMMLPEKKEGWVNVYKDLVYDTKEEALAGISESRGYIDTIKISWEE